MRQSGNLVGLGRGRFVMLEGASPSEIGPGVRGKPDLVDRAPQPKRSRPTLAMQATRAAEERRLGLRRTAAGLGLAAPEYRPGRLVDFVADECRWPLDPFGSDVMCGARQVPGSPYCEAHRRRSRARSPDSAEPDSADRGPAEAGDA